MSSVLLQNGDVLAIGGNGSNWLPEYNIIEQYHPATDTWILKVPLPFTFAAGSAVTLDDGSVLLAGGHQGGVYSTSTYIYSPNGISTPAVLPTLSSVNEGVNNGYFIGSTSNMGSKVFGNINSMLFHEDLASVSAMSGQLHGSQSTLDGHNTGVTFDFGHFIDTTTSMVNYINDDNKIIWGNAIINSKNATIGFASLPDKVNADNSLTSDLGDFSSWGYWEAMSTDSTEYYNGYWVSGQPTPASYIQGLIDNHTPLSYSGHVLGDTLTTNGTKDAIVLNNANKFNMTVNFGSANPINVTALSFTTSQGWSYNQSTNLTNTSPTLTGANSYTATVGNSVNTTDTLKLQGKFFGPTANSTGGAFAGTLTGTKNAVDSARAVQGVFKARQ
jgi:hypothetical protein